MKIGTLASGIFKVNYFIVKLHDTCSKNWYYCYKNIAVS